MIDDAVGQNIDRWLDGDLPVAEETALRIALENDPKSLSLLADRAVLHGLLRDVAGRPAITLAWVDRRPAVVRSAAWVALSLAVCFLFGTMLVLPRADAKSADMVRRVLDTLRTDVDRRYSVRVEPAFPRVRAARARPQPPVSTLLVRGTRFVQSTEIEGRFLAWGRDARGAVWFTVSPRSVAVFGADEIPDALGDVSDLRTLDLATMLETLRRDFELERSSGSGATDTIIGRPRDRASRFGRVEISIERESLQVQGMVIQRRHRGRLTATVRFVLEETAARDEGAYEWRGHVDADAEVLDGTAVRGARRDLLTEFLRIVRQEPADS